MTLAAASRALLLGPLISTLLASVALAQSGPPSNFSAERFALSPSRSGVLDAEWGSIPAGWSWDAGIYFDEARNPLALYREADFQRVGALLRTRSEVGVVAAVGWGQRLSLGVNLPFTVDNARPSTIPGVTEGTLPAIQGTALNNLRIVPKIGILLAAQQGIDLALVPAFFVPTGPDARYTGDPSVVFQPMVSLSRAIDNFRPVLNAGVTLRLHPEQFINQQIGNELFARLGLAYRFNQKDDRKLPLEVGATLQGSTALRDTFRDFNDNSLEVKAYAAYTLWRWLELFGGGGAGLAKGWGTPDWRVFAGLRVGQWNEQPVRDHDTDGDGIRDGKDACPDQPEDVDGFQDTDGCPDPDNDQDAVPDGSDACPDVAGPVENHGCPDKDRDGDGIVDRLDRCPLQPEDRDGFQDDDGCPDPDNDQDGVPDVSDRCRMEPGPVENHGCPDPDRDRDGVVDRLDSCPDEPGTAENHGCQKKQLALLTADRIVILEAVYFRTGRSEIQKRSDELLDSVARILLLHPELSHVTIEGHTDSMGPDDRNLALSQARAEAVRDYLIGHGILAVRLAARGLGETQPIADNQTAAGRARNRRVEFKLKSDTQSGKVP